MNFQDILKIKRANIKVLFCNKLIDELEKIFIFICQPQINTTLKNGDGVNFERLTEIIQVAGD